MAKLVDLLGHLLAGGAVIQAPDENSADAPQPFVFNGEIMLRANTVTGREQLFHISGANAAMFTAHYTPEQEEINRLKLALVASRAEITRLVNKEKADKAPRVQMDLELYIEIREYLDIHPTRSTAKVARELDYNYNLVARVKSGHYSDLEGQYSNYKSSKQVGTE